MPTPYIEELAVKHNKSVEEVEKLWNKAKALAAKEGKPDNYGYITGILKRMVGESIKEEDMEQVTEASLTKKHMIAAAKAVSQEPDMKVRKMLHDHHAEIFRAANPSFNAAKFKQACGLNESTETIDEKRKPIDRNDEYEEFQAAKQKEIAKREQRRATALRKRDTSMRESIDSFIQAALGKDDDTAQAHLAQILMDKITDRLEELRYDVAQQHFGLEESTLSAKAGAAGKDLGKPGKGFEKMERSGSARYGAGHGEKIAGAVLAKMRAKAGVK